MRRLGLERMKEETFGPDTTIPKFLEMLTQEEQIELIVDELCLLSFLLGYYYIDEARQRTKVLIYAKRN